MFSLEN